MEKRKNLHCIHNTYICAHAYHRTKSSINSTILQCLWAYMVSLALSLQGHMLSIQQTTELNERDTHFTNSFILFDGYYIYMNMYIKL